MIFSAVASRSGFGAVISCAAVRSCIVFCKAVSAASRFLGAMAACVILLSFAAEHRKSHWNGCTQVAIVILQAIFCIFTFAFPIKSLIKKRSKSCFFRLWRRDPVLEL